MLGKTLTGAALFQTCAQSQLEFDKGSFFIRQPEDLSRRADFPSRRFKLFAFVRFHVLKPSMISLLRSVSGGACNPRLLAVAFVESSCERLQESRSRRGRSDGQSANSYLDPVS